MSDDCATTYKYNILESVIVENIILRNAIIDLGAVEVDINCISRDNLFVYHTLKNII